MVYAQAGNDDVKMDDGSTIPAWLFGGDGNDKLKGGAGHDVLLGGAGDDLLSGNAGRDLLIGGTGADHIVGNAGDDVLTGSEGNDWFLFNRDGDGGVKDKATDRSVFEAQYALDLDWLNSGN